MISQAPFKTPSPAKQVVCLSVCLSVCLHLEYCFLFRGCKDIIFIIMILMISKIYLAMDVDLEKTIFQVVLEKCF
jgi:hypothetical protein